MILKVCAPQEMDVVDFSLTLAVDPRVVGIVVGGGNMRLRRGAMGDERYGVLSYTGLDGQVIWL